MQNNYHRKNTIQNSKIVLKYIYIYIKEIHLNQISISAYPEVLMAVSKYKPTNEAIRFTQVSCELSFELTSAKLPLTAWC